MGSQKPGEDKDPWTQQGEDRDEIQKTGPPLPYCVQAYIGNLVLESRAMEPVCERELQRGVKVESLSQEDSCNLFPGRRLWL